MYSNSHNLFSAISVAVPSLDGQSGSIVKGTTYDPPYKQVITGFSPVTITLNKLNKLQCFRKIMLIVPIVLAESGVRRRNQAIQLF